MQASNLVRTVITTLSIVLVTTALIGATWYTTKETPAPLPMVGVTTGEFVDGVPVYRLPSITVTARRSDVLGRTTPDVQR